MYTIKKVLSVRMNNIDINSNNSFIKEETSKYSKWSTSNSWWFTGRDGCSFVCTYDFLIRENALSNYSCLSPTKCQLVLLMHVYTWLSEHVIQWNNCHHTLVNWLSSSVMQNTKLLVWLINMVFAIRKCYSKISW